MILSSLDDKGSSSELTDEPHDSAGNGDGAIGDMTVAPPLFLSSLFSGVIILDVARQLLSSIEIMILNSSHRVLMRVMVAMVKG